MIAGKLLLSSAKILETTCDRVALNPRGKAVLLVLYVRISFSQFTAPCSQEFIENLNVLIHTRARDWRTLHKSNPKFQ